MTVEEQEYNNFMIDISEKAIDLQNKYNKLSENNKQKFLLYIEPMVRAGGIQGFMNQMDLLFNVGTKNDF